MFLTFKLTPNKNIRDERSPTHMIVGRGRHGQDFYAGAAWNGATRENKPFFAMKFDIPELFGDEPQEYVAFRDDDGKFSIKASKPQETAPKAQAA